MAKIPAFAGRSISQQDHAESESAVPASSTPQASLEGGRIANFEDA